MLSLIHESSKIQEKGFSIQKHDLYLCKRHTATYTTERDEIIDFVEKSGIQIPEKKHVARLHFINEQTLKNQPSSYANRMIRRNDKKWGNVYTSSTELETALAQIYETIEQLESHKIDIKAICQHAQTDISGPASVSVAGMGSYFNRFDHFPCTSMHENYHTARETNQDNKKIIFLPRNTIAIIPLQPEQNVC